MNEDVMIAGLLRDISDRNDRIKHLHKELVDSLQREQALRDEWDKMDNQVTECIFHGRDVQTCIQYSGQAPCQCHGEESS